ncbi:MAG: IS701 family transposase [Desulfobacterales bacterium]
MFFRSRTKKFFDKAEKYAKGIFLSNSRNIERVCESQQNLDYFQVQHFISDSNWNARAVIDKAATDVSNALPKRKLTGLIIDETGTIKKGDKSVGVGWQYCGNVGKTGNSQVAVVACLSNGDFASMADARLYLPHDWCDDKQRCERAGIPGEHRAFKTKTELAFDIVENQLRLGTGFDFVGADGFYGNDTELADKLDELGCLYMLDIHSNQQIFMEKPEWAMPERKGARGRRSRILKPNKPSFRADEYCKALDKKDWVELKVRNTAKGKLKGKYHFCDVFVLNKTRNSFEKRLLVIRKVKTKAGEEIKYSVTNTNLAQYTEKAIAYMQAQRFFVEHCIKESKQVLGFDQFQTRKWKAWQHQVALNIMVSCFILKEKLICFDDFPLLSAADIKQWVCFKVAQTRTDQEMIELMFFRHTRRQKDINRYYKNEFLNVSK